MGRGRGADRGETRSSGRELRPETKNGGTGKLYVKVIPQGLEVQVGETVGKLILPHKDMNKYSRSNSSLPKPFTAFKIFVGADATAYHQL